MAKSNFFRNPLRGEKKPYQAYTPQYVIKGLKPEFHSSALIPEETQDQLTRHAPVKSYDNPRMRPPPHVTRNVPFAEIPAGPSPLGDGPLPNIGNNVENTWASVDGEVFDDMGDDHADPVPLDPSQPMIDNNTDDFQNWHNIPSKIKKAPNYQENKSQTFNIKSYDYVLLVDGEVISTGFQDEIQEEVRALVFGEHPLCQSYDNAITPDDIIVLKKVKIKVGVFIE